MELVERLARRVADLSRVQDRVLVGVDGPDAAGKTVLSERLAAAIGGSTLRASIDGFHNPRQVRQRRGEVSPEGYYRDSFDYPALIGQCLLPFRDGASTFQVRRFDYRADAGHSVHATGVPTRAVLVVDGVFLLRDRLRQLWTLSIYLRVSPDETLRRARRRDQNLFGSTEEVDRRYRDRYLPGQVLYRVDANPEARAHILVDNERPDTPVIERWS